MFLANIDRMPASLLSRTLTILSRNINERILRLNDPKTLWVQQTVFLVHCLLLLSTESQWPL